MESLFGSCRFSPFLRDETDPAMGQCSLSETWAHRWVYRWSSIVLSTSLWETPCLLYVITGIPHSLFKFQQDTVEIDISEVQTSMRWVRGKLPWHFGLWSRSESQQWNGAMELFLHSVREPRFRQEVPFLWSEFREFPLVCQWVNHSIMRWSSLLGWFFIALILLWLC